MPRLDALHHVTSTSPANSLIKRLPRLFRVVSRLNQNGIVCDTDTHGRQDSSKPDTALKLLERRAATT